LIRLIMVEYCYFCLQISIFIFMHAEF